MRSCFTLLTAALASLAFAGAAPAQTTLRYKFKEGEKVDYVVTQHQKMNMSVLGKDIDMNVKTVIEMSWHTQKVDDKGNAFIKVAFGHVTMAMDSPMGKIEVDSKAKQDPDDPIGQKLAEVVKAIAGMDMTFTSDSTGELKDTKISDEAVKKLKNIPGADAFGGDMFSPDSMKSMMQSHMVLPKNAVEKGKSWTQKTNQKMPFGRVTGDTKYTYEGEIEQNGKKFEKIATLPNLKIETDANAPVQIKIKGGGGKGHTLFDNQAGRIAESTNETTMQMEIEAGGMTINMNMVQLQTMRLKGGKKGEKSSEKSREKSPR